MAKSSRFNVLTEAARLQRRILLESKRELSLTNTAEDSLRANLPVEDRANIQDLIDPPEVEPDLEDVPDEVPVVDEQVDTDQEWVEEDPIFETPKEKRPMAKPTVVIVGADKGGVGKTTVSRTVLDYFKAHGVEAKAFDTEFPRGVLVRFYPNQAEVVNLRDSDDQIKVFDNLSRSTVTLIDVSAGLLSETLKLLGEIGLLDMVKEEMVDIFVLHVIGSTVASFEEIEGTQKALAGAKHFIVANHTNDAAFFEGIDSVAKDALAKSPRIDIPQLDNRATEHVEASNQSFSDFAKDDKNSFTMRGKVRTWMKAVFEQLDKAKLVS
jgi:hypothetical protein